MSDDYEFAPDCDAVTPEEECGACESCHEAQEAGKLHDIEMGHVRDEPGTTL